MPVSHNEPMIQPLRALQFLAGLATILVALAQFAFKSAPLHDMCLGGALGLLIGVCVFSTGIKTVVLKDTPQRSDVNRYPISR